MRSAGCFLCPVFVALFAATETRLESKYWRESCVVGCVLLIENARA